MNDSKLPEDEKNVSQIPSENLIEAQAKDIIHGKDSPRQRSDDFGKSTKQQFDRRSAAVEFDFAVAHS